VPQPGVTRDLGEGARRAQAVDRGLDAARTRVELRVDEFLDAGFQLLDERGSAEFTLQELVDRTNQSIRGFYQCFESKDDLLLALFEASIRDQIEDLQRHVDREVDPLARLRAFTIRLFEWCAPAGSGRAPGDHDFRPVADFAIQLGLEHPDPVEAAMRPVFDLVLRLVEEANDAGAIAVDDTSSAATLIQRVVVYHWLADRVVRDPRRGITADQTWEFCLHGISGV
jgi:AcrR family transcriptional regulator